MVGQRVPQLAGDQASLAKAWALGLHLRTWDSFEGDANRAPGWRVTQEQNSERRGVSLRVVHVTRMV